MNDKIYILKNTDYCDTIFYIVFMQLKLLKNGKTQAGVRNVQRDTSQATSGILRHNWISYSKINLFSYAHICRIHRDKTVTHIRLCVRKLLHNLILSSCKLLLVQMFVLGKCADDHPQNHNITLIENKSFIVSQSIQQDIAFSISNFRFRLSCICIPLSCGNSRSLFLSCTADTPTANGYLSLLVQWF